ncbi:Carboxylesterase 2 [Symmachiella dynata]|uniref:alpha/beta hydrolase n=1 Tax=Symmachiella dynata TaxID=2527995 RepID=UPI00118CC8E9|nr:hypothetical protein [Symmachiella dynata]QDT46336.1 Carboxylesterase 2 [Symmachiella dynata]
MNAHSLKRIATRTLLTAACFEQLLNGVAHGQDDIADVPSAKYQLKDSALEYHVIGGGGETSPAKGYKVLIALPGGDGSADFLPFVKRIYQHALSDEYLVIQLVAHPWKRNQKIIWPTPKNSVPGMKLSTEEFLAAALDEVAERVKVDKRHVYALGWSSGGPAVYAAALDKKTPLTGAFVAMSVFKPRFLPPLDLAKGRAFYVWHSPDDRVCPYRMARDAEVQLRKNGADVKLEIYPGGHGWRGNVFGALRGGVSWLEEQTQQRPQK